MIDIYTKAVLTVIAVALCVIAAQGLLGPQPAVAQLASSGCGERPSRPCYVASDPSGFPVIIEYGVKAIDLEVNNWPRR